MSEAFEPASSLGIPQSQYVADVSIIDTTAHVEVPLGYFIKNPLTGNEVLRCPSYAFLVENHQGRKILFDLGLRKDTEAFPPVIRAGMAGLTMKAEKNIATILEDEHNIALADIGSIIWSHWHADHTGDPSTFPSTTELVVGPGCKETLLPGYPANPNGLILESDYSGRQLRELNFETGLHIGKFRAVDFFGDGSFYVLDAPGHAVGHVCALARTTPTTFVFMGADGCHHCGCLRPSPGHPVPEQVSPSPFSNPPHLQGSSCSSAIISEIHPKKSRSEPFYARLSAAEGRDVPEAEATISKMIDFDENENVFVVLAHDTSLLDVIDFFPKRANEWKEKGWKQTSRWRFLADFKSATAEFGDEHKLSRQE